MYHPNNELIHTFYRAFDDGDGQTMAACYHDDATFSDPVFPDLSAAEVRAMWQMLCEADDLKVEVSNVSADEDSGQARWDAWYTFTATNRKVHNIIDARFEFQDGLIVSHNDTFDFWRWSRQALGPAGYLLGWTPIVQNKVQSQAGRQLTRWIERRDSNE